jgi:hypothetical protein
LLTHASARGSAAGVQSVSLYPATVHARSINEQSSTASRPNRRPGSRRHHLRRHGGQASMASSRLRGGRCRSRVSDDAASLLRVTEEALFQGSSRCGRVRAFSTSAPRWSATFEAAMGFRSSAGVSSGTVDRDRAARGAADCQLRPPCGQWTTAPEGMVLRSSRW